MSASETAPVASNLHKSIEQLIAETVKQSQTTHATETRELRAALAATLAEIEISQQALARAAEALRQALGTDEQPSIEAEPAPEPATAVAEPAPIEVSPAPASDRGPHEIDVIAHGASFGDASGLQMWLRARSEVSEAQTREFVNGELRLQLSLTSGLDMTALASWLSGHGGETVTSTDSVIEIRFGA